MITFLFIAVLALTCFAAVSACSLAADDSFLRASLVVLFILIIALSSLVFKERVVKQEAVDAGAAEWVADSKGKVKFYWKGGDK